MESENPYAAPATMEPPPTSPGFRDGFNLASQGQRFVNLIIDNITIQVVAAIAGGIIGFAYASSRVAAGQQITEEELGSLQLVGYAIGFAISLAYFFLSEWLTKRTLGKLVSGTRVVSATGGEISIGQALGRTVARFIPFEAFSFLGGKGYPVGWHDSLTRTRVIKAR